MLKIMVALGLHKDEGQFRSGISELQPSVGKMFNCTPPCNSEEVPIMMFLRVILKGILKAYFRLINSLIESQSIFGKLAIKYKIRVETLSVLYI